jgi:hypothetical protein
MNLPSTAAAEPIRWTAKLFNKPAEEINRKWRWAL